MTGLRVSEIENLGAFRLAHSEGATISAPGHDEVHVWSVTLPAAGFAQLSRVLSQDELDRAQKFHFERDRLNFIGRRAILRALLASYLDSAPASLQFSYNEFGKPRLDGSAGKPDLRFNLSHSRELVRIAIAVDREVGVDVEIVDESVPIDSVARNFFSTMEIGAIEGLSEAHRLRGFFNCWTMKEAYVKARGMGLSMPLTSFDVSVRPEGSTTLIEEDLSRRVWKVRNVESNSRYSVSVAAVEKAWIPIKRELEIKI